MGFLSFGSSREGKRNVQRLARTSIFISSVSFASPALAAISSRGLFRGELAKETIDLKIVL
jgi:hypothetical protein